MNISIFGLAIWLFFFAVCLWDRERCSGNQAAFHSHSHWISNRVAWQWSEDPILSEFHPEVYCSCGFQLFLKSWRGLLIYSLRCHSSQWHSTETNPKLQIFTYQAELHILMFMRMITFICRARSRIWWRSTQVRLLFQCLGNSVCSLKSQFLI